MGLLTTLKEQESKRVARVLKVAAKTKKGDLLEAEQQYRKRQEDMIEEDPKQLLNQFAMARLRSREEIKRAVTYDVTRDGQGWLCCTVTLAFLPERPTFTFSSAEITQAETKKGWEKKAVQTGAAKKAAMAFKQEIIYDTTSSKTHVHQKQKEVKRNANARKSQTVTVPPSIVGGVCEPEPEEVNSPSGPSTDASVNTWSPEKVSEDSARENEFKTLTSWLIAGQQATLEVEKKQNARRVEALEAQVTSKQEELNRERELHIRQRTREQLRHADRVQGLHRKYESQLGQVTAETKELESQLKQEAEEKHQLQLQLQLEQNRQKVTKMSELIKKNEGETVCAVCWDRPATQVLVPCGHYGVCTTCLPNLHSQCPICKKPFESNTRLFFASATRQPS